MIKSLFSTLLKIALAVPFEKRKRSEADIEAARLLMEMAKAEHQSVHRARETAWRIHLCIWAVLSAAGAALLHNYPLDGVSVFRSGALWMLPVAALLLHGIWLAQTRFEEMAARREFTRLAHKARERVKDLSVLGALGKLELPRHLGAASLAAPLLITLALSSGTVWLVKEKIDALDEANQRFQKLSMRVDEISRPVDYLEGISPFLYAYEAPVVDGGLESTRLFEAYFSLSRPQTAAAAPTVSV